MDADEALRRLRSADPGADVNGVWAGSPAHQVAMRHANADVPAPRNRTRLLAVVAAAAVVLAVAAATTLLHRAATTTAGIGTKPVAPTSTRPPAPSGSPRDRTEALLTKLLAGVQPLPGASPADTPPDPRLKSAPTTPGSPNVLEHRAWWTAPGSLEAAIQFYRAHPPDGLTYSGRSTSTGTKGSPGPDSLIFDHPDTSYGREVEVLVSVVPQSNGVAVGAYAQAIWVPTRDPATMLAGVTSVEVVVARAKAPGRPGAPTVERTVTGADAKRLAAAVNRLSVTTPGAFNCPAMFAGITDALDFVTPTGTVHVTENLTGCSGVELTLPDGSKHAFEAGSLNATLMRVLGLPRNYGLS